MKPEEKLDKVLNYLYSEYIKGNMEQKHSKNICNSAGLKIHNHEAYLMLEKLSLDGYLKVNDSNKWMFEINYNGVLFVRYGGYKQEFKDLNRKRIKNDIYNVTVGLGTFLAGAFALWSIWKEFSSFVC
ncbi:hypothetical protein [Tenacibaculum finnmarkense]|uniref:hypothetical protein n=1 Tax=Tenacibaculum finnmarkense TaxID=2781243 RepID=UPI00187B68E2|nr:hypothetical protein [Tenacibaculum finnmarkense]MBE7661475.1 hypothetical protein [Tenacibaculum finnmarkense genomovar finnmarkense]MCG8253173.1 hypothetical protein [Tenacibaculum finnmarkense genomovar finnmarkense]MCG8816570.1 hypothetical protein [Tenacibaculum finnmarkense]MCG8821608.1 hypothetical protein [Tenacibaculum finnmarkense]